jgi:hypothetical protein
MNKYTLIKIALIAITIGTLVMVTLSSCSANRYGCGHGNPKMTWNRMVKSINRP